LGLKWEPLIQEYRNFNSEKKKNFSVFFENECNYIIDKIELDKGIAKNRILKENIFLLFIAITSNIPLIIIGKPGSSKSLSFQQLKKSMRGKYSKNIFFRRYPNILTTYFQGSDSTLAEDIENLFEKGKEQLKKYENNENNDNKENKNNREKINKENNKENNKKNKKINNKENNKPISLLIFDEIGLSEFAKDNPVKALHKNLEYDKVRDGLSFIGFSNWKLDASKLNRVLCLSVPDLDSQIDDLKDTAKCIAESIRGENNIEPILLNLICKSYKSYQETVKKIKEYVVYKELELQEMRQVLGLLDKDEINRIFNNEKKITLEDFKKKRCNIELQGNYSWKYKNFYGVKNMNEYKILYEKNRTINHEFHGNRDFYNYNKGICNIKSLSKNSENIDVDVNKQIEKVIERNFGGVDICIDLDFGLNYDDESDNDVGFGGSRRMVAVERAALRGADANTSQYKEKILQRARRYNKQQTTSSNSKYQVGRGKPSPLTVRLLVAGTSTWTAKLLGLAATRISHKKGTVVAEKDVLDLLL